MPPSPDTVLAEALTRVRQIARDDIVRSQDVTRGDRELLVSRNWLREIIRGWYLLTTPEAKPGDTVIWHSSFWAFVSAYIGERFGRRYCFSVLAAQFNGNMFAKGRRTAAKIHCYIEHSAMGHPHQLSLRLQDLIVNSAQHVFC